MSTNLYVLHLMILCIYFSHLSLHLRGSVGQLLHVHASHMCCKLEKVQSVIEEHGGVTAGHEEHEHTASSSMKPQKSTGGFYVQYIMLQ